MLIVGGGIGGLATALALARHGLPSLVLERRHQFQEEGAGIQIGPNGTRILRDLGVAERLQPHVGVPQLLIVHDGGSGAVLACMALGSEIEQRFGAPYWVAHREDLHAALLAEARKQSLVNIAMGWDVATAGSDARTAVAIDRDGRVLTGPAIVGADGLRSRVRGAATGAGIFRPVGKSAFRSVILSERLPAALHDGNTHIWLMPDAHVVHYPVRGGAETALVLITDDTSFAGEGFHHAADAGALSGHLAMGAGLRAVLQAADGWRKWALSEPVATWPLVAGRIALVGDAAHPILPFLAQGGVLALEDAVVLAAALARGADDVPRALAAYARARQTRVRRVASASRRNGAIYHMRGAAASARNAVLRFTPPRRLISRYDWIYGWGSGAKS